jgi:hypothetical protein
MRAHGSDIADSTKRNAPANQARPEEDAEGPILDDDGEGRKQHQQTPEEG